MVNFLVKLFIKNYKDIKNPAVREAYGKLGSIIGIICNLLLAGSKILVGIFFNSVSITADGINNLSDTGSSIIALIGFKISSKPADEDHPFGHARGEYISSFTIAFIIMILGIQLILSSFQKIRNPEPIQVSTLTISVLVGSILIKLWLAYINRVLGKKIGSTTMKATSTDSLNDVITTSAVLVSILIFKFTQINIDAYMGIVVALFIIYSGIGILKDTISPLLGQAPDEEFEATICDKILSYEGVLGLHDLVVHNYGPNRCFASVHVEVSAKEDILKSHDLIDAIEKDFSLELGIHLVIHLDPIMVGDPLTHELHELTDTLVRSIDPTLSIHDFRVVVGNTYKNLIFDVTIPHGLKLSDQELIRQIDAKIAEENATYRAVVTIDRSYTSTQGKKYKN